MELLVGEPAEIELNPNNMNWEDGFSLQRSLKPFIHSLKENKAAGGFQGQNSLTLTPVTTHQPHLFISQTWSLKKGRSQAHNSHLSTCTIPTFDP
jgi:hypothetical protein